MMRAYAVIAGRMLFGSDIWELRNRYTLSVFNKKSIADIEVFNNIPGLRRVAVQASPCKEEDGERGVDEGIYRHLQKPFRAWR